MSVIITIEKLQLILIVWHVCITKTLQWKNAVEITCQETWPSMIYFDQQLGACATSFWPKTVYYSLVTQLPIIHRYSQSILFVYIVI